MFVEFYNLGKEDGLSFPVQEVSLCDITLRLLLEDDQWYHVDVRSDYDMYVDGKLYIDFAVMNKPSDDFVQHQDFFPTICGLLGEDTGEIPVAGRDVFDADSVAPERITTGWHGNVSVRDTDWNMIIDSTGGDGPRALYDLAADPTESTNVYDERPDVVAELTSFLEAALGPLPFEIKHRGDNRMAPSLYCLHRKDR